MARRGPEWPEPTELGSDWQRGWDGGGPYIHPSTGIRLVLTGPCGRWVAETGDGRLIFRSSFRHPQNLVKKLRARNWIPKEISDERNDS